MRLYLCELKKMVVSPLIMIALTLFVGMNVLFMPVDGLGAEQMGEIYEIVKLRSEKGILTFDDVGKYHREYDNIFDDGATEDSRLVGRDIGLGKNTDFYFLRLNTVFHMIFAENALLCFFLVVFTFGIENVSDMEQMLYSSKTGTAITLHKLAAVITLVILGNIILSTLTVLAFTVKTGLPALWGIRMNCPYLHESLFDLRPYRPILNMTLLEYTLIILLMVLVLAIAFAIFVFSVMYLFSGLLTGSGTCMILLLTDYAVSYILLSKYPRHVWQGSFSSLYLTMDLWLTDLKGAYIVRYQELWVMPVLLLISLLMLLISLVRLKNGFPAK